MKPIVGRDLFVEDGIKLLRQCFIGRGLKLERLMIFFV
jgi:hypothetical protein